MMQNEKNKSPAEAPQAGETVKGAPEYITVIISGPATQRAEETLKRQVSATVRQILSDFHPCRVEVRRATGAHATSPSELVCIYE